jgi:SAM-dependent methyltransferase
MKLSFAQRLACPFCKTALSLQVASQSGEEILEGALKCGICQRAFPVRGGIPRFVRSDAYASSFSFEWKRWRRTQFDKPSRAATTESFISSTGRTPRQLAGKLVLDAGCGTGRFMDVLALAGAEVVGVDLSEAAEVAFQNTRDRANCHVVQADLMNLPFRSATFDFAYSIGVLHHTPDTRRAFLRMVEALKPGGEIAIWVYPRHRLTDALEYFPQCANQVIRQDVGYQIPQGWEPKVRPFAPWFDWITETSSDVLRLVSTRLPTRWLYALCHLAVPLYHLFRIPLFYPLRLVIKISMDQDPEWRVLDTFDWYSAHYQWKHTFPELRRWFEQAGLNRIEICPRIVAMRGQLPEIR